MVYNRYIEYLFCCISDRKFVPASNENISCLCKVLPSHRIIMYFNGIINRTKV